MQRGKSLPGSVASCDAHKLTTSTFHLSLDKLQDPLTGWELQVFKLPLSSTFTYHQTLA